MEDRRPSDGHINSSMDIILNFLLGAIVIIIYVIGFYLHIKLIKAAKQDKSMTWMIDIANSIFMLCNRAHVILMNAVTYMIDDLYIYTGSWFCYTSKALTIIGNTHLISHTFIIAIMKYVMIVLHDKVRVIGKEKMKGIFLMVNVLFPIYMFAVFNIMYPDFLFIYDGVSQAKRCLGEPELFSSQNPNKTATKLNDVCEFSDSFESWSIQKSLRLTKSIVCWFHCILIYLFLWNLVEAFIYYFVFKSMWR